MTGQLAQFIPVGLLCLVAALMAGAMLALPTLLGKKRSHQPVKDSAYECGLPSLGDAHPQFSVKFYLVAMLFILLDIEVVFLLGWSAVFRDLIRPARAGGLGLEMLGGTLLFLAILEVGHLYAWKKGALDWTPRRRPQSKEREPKSEGRPDRGRQTARDAAARAEILRRRLTELHAE